MIKNDSLYGLAGARHGVDGRRQFSHPLYQRQAEEARLLECTLVHYYQRKDTP